MVVGAIGGGRRRRRRRRRRGRRVVATSAGGEGQRGSERQRRQERRRWAVGVIALSAGRSAPRAAVGVEHAVGLAEPPLSPTPHIGCSIHRCAVAVVAECVTVVSSRSFSSAEIRPGGYRVIWHARHVGERLAAAADRRLHHLGDDRGEDQQGEADERQRVAPAVVVAVAARRARRSTTSSGSPMSVSSAIGADQRDGERRHEDVVVADVRQLVGEDAFELDAVHLLEQPGRDRDRRVLRVASGGERVRRRVVDDVDPRAWAGRRRCTAPRRGCAGACTARGRRAWRG